MMLIHRVKRFFGGDYGRTDYPVYDADADDQIKETKRVVANLVMPLELNPDRMAAEELYGVIYREVGRGNGD